MVQIHSPRPLLSPRFVARFFERKIKSGRAGGALTRLEFWPTLLVSAGRSQEAELGVYQRTAEGNIPRQALDFFGMLGVCGCLADFGLNIVE